MRGMSPACWRSISSTISDSGLPSPTAVALPALSRVKRTSGWPSTCTPTPISASAMLTESTRNGMSSLMICSTVCGASQPLAWAVALNTRTLAVPGLRARANSSMSAAMAAQISGAWCGYSSSAIRL